jgi:steroid 5-alpha reductase family enzyme
MLVCRIGWAVSSLLKTDHLYDLTGAIAHIASTLLALLGQHGKHNPRIILATLMVNFWAVRLGAFLFRRVLHSGGDSRLEKYKTKPLSYLVLWVAQFVWVLMNTLPLLLLHYEDSRRSDFSNSTLHCLACGCLAW